MPAKIEKSGLFGAWIPILLPAVFLTSLGLLILVSAGAGGDDPYAIFRKQAMWLFIALAAGFFAAFVDLKFLKKIAVPVRGGVDGIARARGILAAREGGQRLAQVD